MSTVVAGVGRASRAEQVGATRQQILTTAERLFAERGLYAVSNRRISAAAGQGNNTAVGYHFGTKVDLVRAIMRRHTSRIESLRQDAVAAAAGSREVRDWVACLVRPVTAYLASSGGQTWFARFSAQVMTDPALRAVVAEEALAEASLRHVVDNLVELVPDLPPDVREDRAAMVRRLIVHACAERERALAEGAATPRSTWDETASGLIDAITGLWSAPCTEERR
ncbi:TetR/AcrR family transcriptional regulator [Actinosynnema sp. NPDC053489]|uniref:TetR/AcrR family transcriptional regulator n=1 Tax=Actinosynnema sp. NPDC053489 TaxID=3363916 RepID=UPI0037C67659